MPGSHIQLSNDFNASRDDLSALSRPQRFQLAGGGTLREIQLRKKFIEYYTL
jgi:hypothetical protein